MDDHKAAPPTYPADDRAATSAFVPPRSSSAPPSPTQETPAELNSLLDEMLESRRALLMHEGKTFEEQEAFCDREDAARSALLALYTRQQEEIDRLQQSLYSQIAQSDADFQASAQGQEIISLRFQVTSLSSQLERLKGECNGWGDLTENAEGRVEYWQKRAIAMEADQERINLALTICGIGGIYDVFEDPADAIVQMSAYIKEHEDKWLRRLSSDSGTGREK